MEDSASPMRDTSQDSRAAGKGKGANTDNVPAKRRCVSTACIACRRRKSKVREFAVLRAIHPYQVANAVRFLV